MKTETDSTLRKDTNVDNIHLKKIIRWNRFLTILIVCASIAGGFKYLENRIIAKVTRLELDWMEDSDTHEKFGLEFSTSLGGPFIITHLVTESRGYPDPAVSATAELPHPLYMRGPKGHAYIYDEELKKLKWFDSSGKKVAPPRPGDPVIALYYVLQNVGTDQK